MTSDFGYSKSLRLLNAAAFKAVFDQVDYKISSKEVLCLAKKNSFDHPRLGLIIAKKNIRFAAQRNQIKRIVRESFRLHQHQLPATDIIIMVHKGMAELDNAAVRQVIDQTWQRLAKKAKATQAC